MKKCVICGKRIRTGRKYCFEHRNIKSSQKKNTNERDIFIVVIGMVIGFYFIFNGNWIGILFVLMALGLFFNIIGQIKREKALEVKIK